MTLRLPRLLGIVDTALCARLGLDPVKLVDDLLEAGLPMLRLRATGLPPDEHLALAARCAGLAREANTPFVVSDRVDIARLVGAGVHLPVRGLGVGDARALLPPDLPVGRSAHDGAELEAASAADYATLSPVHTSTSKPDHHPRLAIGALRSLARKTPVPVFALGGAGPADAALVPDFHGIALLGPLHGLGARPAAEVIASCIRALPP